MDVVRFTLSGRFAFFKKPDVNTYLYFSYSNIHKVALLGILGGILGYGGYNQQSGTYPEFYSKLKNLKVAIVPKDAVIPKKVQIFNNSVGYASKEQGGNLIVKEQWLENPSWKIYIAIEDEEGKKIAKALLKRNFAYIPYLGKNDHPADINDIVFTKSVKVEGNFNNVDSLFIKDDFKLDKEYFEDDLENDNMPIFKYEEKLPQRLEEKTNKYELENFIYTNAKLIANGDAIVYDVDGKNIVFI